MTEFSRIATSRLSLARCIPSVYASKPRAIRPAGNAFVCTEMNKSALFRLAILARSCNGMNTSVLRVYITLTSPQLLSTYLPKAKATFRLMSFSREYAPNAPVSWPPCPASITRTNLLPAQIAVSTDKNNNAATVAKRRKNGLNALQR